MKILEEVSPEAIAQHLQSLGAGNQNDNKKQLSQFSHCYLAELTRSEFMALVFLETDITRKMIASAGCRRLESVAHIAASLHDKELGPNWDLSKIKEDTKRMLDISTPLHLPALLLRQSRDGETAHGICKMAHIVHLVTLWL